VSKQRNSVGIAAKSSDVLLDPEQCRDLVDQSEVAPGVLLGAGFEESCKSKKLRVGHPAGPHNRNRVRMALWEYSARTCHFYGHNIRREISSFYGIFFVVVNVFSQSPS
jgi:hypothetical protein